MEMLILICGLPALVLGGFGIWMLKRETGDAVRAIGYLLTALGAAAAVAIAVISLAFGVSLFL